MLGPEGYPRGADRAQSPAHRAPQALNANRDVRDGGGRESELNLFPSEMTEEKTEHVWPDLPMRCHGSSRQK